MQNQLYTNVFKTQDWLIRDRGRYDDKTCKRALNAKNLSNKSVDCDCFNIHTNFEKKTKNVTFEAPFHK